MSQGTILLLSFIAGFAYFSRRFLGDPQLERPIILGPLVGLIMGDLQTGLVVGGTLELIFMGAQAIGGSVPPNTNIGSVLGTAFAISAGQGLESALVIAVPAALLGSLAELFAKGISSAFVSAAEYYADQANARGVATVMHLGNLAHFLSNAIPVYLALTFGSGAVESIIEGFPGWAETGFRVAGGALPALGFGLLLVSLGARRLLPFFFIGFLIAVYTQFGVLGVAALGALTAIIIVVYRQTEEVGVEVGAPGAAAEQAEAEARRPSQEWGIVSQSEARQLFWRSFGLQSAFSFDRMQSIGFTWTLMPILERLYKAKDEFSQALRRHLVFFNTHPWVVGPVLAMVSTMEARRAEGEDVDVEAIQGVKAGLMGPLAGIGDSTFFGMWRPLVGGIAASLALEGNPLAPLLFFFGINIVMVYVRWESLMYTFRQGARFVERMESERMAQLMEAATITGLMALGALVGTWLSIKTPLTYTVQDASVSVQTVLDNILPKMLPLATTLGVYWAVRKGYRTTTILITMAVVFFALGAVGILG
jgi:PTS system mannose-specific IID component